MLILSLITFCLISDSISYQYRQTLISDSVREISFFVKIPTHRLQATLVSDSNLYKYEVRIIVYDRKKRQIGGDFWINEKIVDSESPPPFFLDTFKIVAPTGPVKIRLLLKDSFSEKYFQIWEDLEPLFFIVSFLIHPAKLIEQDSVSLRLDLANIAGKELDSLVITLQNRPEINARRNIPKDKAVYSDTVEFDLTAIPSGDYQFELLVYKKNNVVENRKIPFTLRRSFFREDRLYFEKVRQLRYIATDKEMKELKNLPQSEREKGWKEFWKKKDENPSTDVNETMETYFERIAYAQENFGHGDRGWESDRGMIYVKFGPPDEIERHAFEPGSEDYEIWYYYKINRKFLFIDLFGQGIFVLTTRQGTRI